MLRRALIVLFVWLACLAPAYGQALDLTDSPTRVMIADDPAFADPDLDDSAWPVQPLLQPNGWPARGAAFNDGRLWQRVHFDGAEMSSLQTPAVYFGQFFGAARFYLNGIQIGSIGLLDEPFMGHQTTHNTKAIPLILSIPDGLLRTQSGNVLAMELWRDGLENSGVFTGPLEITEETLAREKANQDIILFTVLNATTVLILSVAALVSAVLWLTAPRQAGMGWLCLSCFAFTPFVVVSSTLFLVLEVPTPPILFPYVFVALAAAVFAPLLQFAAIVLQRKVGWFGRLVQGLSVVLALSHFAGHRNESVLLWMVVALASFSLVSVWAISAVRRSHRPGLPILVGVGSLWLSILLAILGLENQFIAAWGSQSSDLALAIFLGCLAWAGAQSLFDSRARLAAVQSQVLLAQETERRRVAYDIHDGVGQWLSAIKLNLQMLQGRHRGTPAEGEFREVVSHVDAAITDTRRIAHDLSPAMIDKKGLVAAMESHADVVTRQTGIELRVQADADLVLDAESQGHLYRIFQEALQNAVRHGRASMIIVDLSESGSGFALSIRDNGVGFDDDSSRAGLGLDSIRQRALLLGARVDISSHDGQGTSITVKHHSS